MIVIRAIRAHSCNPWMFLIGPGNAWVTRTGDPPYLTMVESDSYFVILSSLLDILRFAFS